MDESLRIYTKGKAFNDAVYDLRVLEVLVKNYRIILDRLVAVQLGRRQISPSIQHQLDYQVRIEQGSLLLLIDFILRHKELLLASATTESPGLSLAYSVVKLYTAALDLRKAATSFLEKGLHFNIQINNSFNIQKTDNSVNITGNIITIPDSRTLLAAQATRYPTDELLRNIDGTNIESIDVSIGKSSYVITSNDRNLVGQAREELNATIEVTGRLDMIAFSSHRGMIISDQEKFPVRWEDSIRQKMQHIADIPNARFKVKPIIDRKTLGSDAIAFHVIDCAEPNEPLFK